MQTPRILVTGGGRGIGRAIALRFAAEGAQVVVAARTADQVAAVASEAQSLGAEALGLVMDVSDLASVEAGLHAALEFTGGGLDVLVNNAGIFQIKPIQKMSPATWYRNIAVNLNGPFHVTLMALKGLQCSPRAHIFNISSIAAKQAFGGNTAYGATKAGLVGFGDSLRIDLEPEGIRVSTVYPGGTDTSIFDAVPGEWDRASMNRPEDVADVVWAAFLAPEGVNVDNLDVPNPRTGP